MHQRNSGGYSKSVTHSFKRRNARLKVIRFRTLVNSYTPILSLSRQASCDFDLTADLASLGIRMTLTVRIRLEIQAPQIGFQN